MTISRGLFVTGIDTNIGKTIASAILKEALNADYWKPVQCGDLDNSDTLKVQELTEKKGKIHPETYALKNPLSPHQAAEREGKKISISDFSLPQSSNLIVVEGAGGLLVPLNDKDTILDLITTLKLPVVIVSKNYLGSLNHTLLTIEALKKRNIQILGLIFNGRENAELEEFLCHKSDIPKLLNIQDEKSLSKKIIKKYSNRLIKQGVINDIIKPRQRTHLAPLHPGKTIS